ncbi:MAG TPA: apolipoprotein N-acyltransferase [Candidatus Eisenbacteria bacterium]|nr:apolipoprotein N-acyltransferase [Candidatus Eisenbacteria bacterium]
MARRGLVRTLGGVVATGVAFSLYSRVEPRWFALGWVGLVPWLLALDRTTTWRGVLASGVAMSIAFTLGVFSWFADAMADYVSVPLWLMYVVLVVGAPFFQPQVVAFSLVRHAARWRGFGATRRALAGACAYVATEWALPRLFGDTIGQGFFASPVLRQAADVAGAPGLTFVLVVANECVHEAVTRMRRRESVLAPIAAVALLFAALGVYGAMRLRQLDRAETLPPLRVAIVQGDVVHYDRLAAEVGTYEAVRRILDTHFDLSATAVQHDGVDLVVWPETVYPTTFGTPKSPEGAAFDREIGAFVVRSRRPLVFGSYDGENGHEYNAAVFLEPTDDGAVTFDTYRKASLFPLTERVPAWLDGPRLRRWLPWLGTWTPGDGATVVSLALPDGRSVRVAPLVCYDAVEPRNAAGAVREGAELIVTLSNDSWLGAGAHLHFVVSALRSVETRRPQVRATTTGVSAVITPTGELTAVADVHVQTVLVGSVTPVRGEMPLAVRWGDWLGPVALVLGLAFFFTRPVHARTAM